ncbi:MAG: efflux RND transporter permease subunit [bacterium]
MIAGLVRFAVQRRVTIVMITMAVVAFGLVGYSRLSLNLLPDISYPSLTVQTEFPDTAPAEVENLVTRPVEEAVGVLRGLQSIHSVSRAGQSEVTLEFDWGTNMDALSMDVREKLDRLDLPDEAENPVVLRFDPSLDPVMRIAVRAPATITDIRSVSDRRLKPSLETVHGVASADVKGGLEEEIQIDIDQGKLSRLGVPIEQVRQVLAVSNINLPGGALRDADTQYLVRTVNEYDTVEEIAELVIANTDGRPVVLRDVADVRRGHKEREEITRVGGEECVEIAIYKEGDANAVTVANAVREHLLFMAGESEEQLENATPGTGAHDLPDGWRTDVLFDQSRFIKQSTDEVVGAAISGGLLVTLVLFLFLRDLRSTVIIAISIPLSVIATFLFMYRLGLSLNIMSLGGITLGIGMLLDNAIVVLEVIHRRLTLGESPKAAAISGTTEVGSAIIASTLTSVAVFLPLIFVQGIAGQIFKDQAITVSIIQIVSLVIGMTMVPMLASIGRRRMLGGLAAERSSSRDGSGALAPPLRAASPPGAAHSAAPAGHPALSARPAEEDLSVASPSSVPEFTLGRWSRAYDGVLVKAIARPWLAIALATVLFAASLALVPFLGMELIPQVSEGEFYFDVAMPEGSPLVATDRTLLEMERIVASEPEVESYYTSVGIRQAAGGMVLRTKDESVGQLNVVMKKRDNAAAEDALAERLRARFAAIPDVRTKLGHASYMSLSTPVELLLFGENIDALAEDSRRVLEGFGEIPGLVDARSSLEEGNPEYQIVFNRPRVAALGLDLAALSNTLKDRVQGVVATRYKEMDRQIDIRVRNREPDRDTAADIKNLVVANVGGSAIPLTAVADVQLDRGPAEIHRIQQQRCAVISANLEGRSLSAVVRDVGAFMQRTPLSRGVTWEMGGQNREMEVSFKSLRFALILAVFLVYLVMAATFESLVHPLIILFTIPLALTGIAPTLLILGQKISIIVFMGVILLAGIVVNNAIVLIDAVNQERREGVGKAAAVRSACHTRLRPILMTTITTVLGLVPMALGFGQGAELRSPLAITVASGLLGSTLLTLVVIPAVYVVVPSRVGSAADARDLAARDAAALRESAPATAPAPEAIA